MPMITRETPLDLELHYAFPYDITKILFFDIETTGFSAETTYLYLIGCIYYNDNSFHLVQWFSEGIHEEELVIASFFEFLKKFEVLIHYNGTGFDIPYLERKCFLKKLPYSFDGMKQIDLYKKIYPYRKILNLSDYKQKSIESFLKISRKDTFSGGELIEVYASFVGKRRYERLKRKRQDLIEKKQPSNDIASAKATSPIDRTATQQEVSEAEILLNQLLLHNEDDLKGLVQICPILLFADLFEKPFHIQRAKMEGPFLTIVFELISALPVPIHYSTDIIHFTAKDMLASLQIQLLEGELKHYYENYKDYYYLPAEDRAIHKSLAAFVDKDYRVKAKPATCYTRKKGVFAPQFEPVISPYFKQNYSDKISFLEIHMDFLLQEDNLIRYVEHILKYMIRSK